MKNALEPTAAQIEMTKMAHAATSDGETIAIHFPSGPILLSEVYEHSGFEGILAGRDSEGRLAHILIAAIEAIREGPKFG